ncbi:PA3496 family putative envelope integrity protein [Legionella fairfieldensis]|uniref:PA3496 family putative envelope integrity protein n=1 Tax=Legionella fairfieldensis TaxID=45064 RepID=UPI00048C8DB1|nr:hypothetical protein [Legionella fairfieldensis]
MSLQKDYEENASFSDYSYEEDAEQLTHKKRVRKMLEEHLERKRLKEEFKDEFDELNDDFDWEELNR